MIVLAFIGQLITLFIYIIVVKDWSFELKNKLNKNNDLYFFFSLLFIYLSCASKNIAKYETDDSLKILNLLFNLCYWLFMLNDEIQKLGFLDVFIVRVFFTCLSIFGWESFLNLIEVGFWNGFSIMIDLDFLTISFLTGIIKILFNYNDKVVIDNFINLDIKPEKNGIYIDLYCRKIIEWFDMKEKSNFYKFSFYR